MTGIRSMRRCMRLIVVVYIILLACLFVWWQSGTFVNEGKLNSVLYDRNDHKHTAFNSNVLNARQSAVQNNDDADNMDDQYLKHLAEGQQSLCKNKFVGYQNLFAKLTNVTINPSLYKGKVGGENITSVLNQAEDDEFCKLQKGFFSLPCNDILMYTFLLESHLNNWLFVTNTTTDYYMHTSVQSDWTIALVRYEYANLYHTMTDFYNTFLVAKFFQIPADNVSILWIDGHPFGILDQTWRTLFVKVIRVSDLQRPVMYQNLIWGIVGYNSPLNNHFLSEVRFLEEFRDFFLTKHKISYKDEVDCDKLNILLIWRRDYLAHPRNPSGIISRKIKNEDDLLREIQELFKSHNVAGLQIDELPMKKQLEIISKTDVLIGMHGAGLSHTMFLPRHAGLIEMFPTYYLPENRHFQCMATWRHLHYIQWNNVDPSKDINQEFTIVNSKEIAELTKEMHIRICRGKALSSNGKHNALKQFIII